MSDSLQPHGLQFTRPPCSSPTLGGCHPTISSSVVPFSSCLQSFPASGSFPVSQFFTSGGQSIRVSDLGNCWNLSLPLFMKYKTSYWPHCCSIVKHRILNASGQSLCWQMILQMIQAKADKITLAQLSTWKPDVCKQKLVFKNASPVVKTWPITDNLLCSFDWMKTERQAK